jgi:hypothetical protein
VGGGLRKHQSEVSRLFADVVGALPTLVRKATGRLQPWLICNIQFHDDTSSYFNIAQSSGNFWHRVQFQGSYA